ncbi:MAG: hypothetical protein AAB368_13450, partial [bacterium]
MLIAAAEVSRTIDGSAADWATVTPGVVNAGGMSGTEWFWRDKQAEQRTVSLPASTTSNYDLVEFHMVAATSDIYFMARLKDITDVDLPLIGVSIDSDQSTSDTAIVQVSTASLNHGGEYLAPAAAHYGEYAMIVHSIATGNTAIEVRPDASSTWSAPA